MLRGSSVSVRRRLRARSLLAAFAVVIALTTTACAQVSERSEPDPQASPSVTTARPGPSTTGAAMTVKAEEALTSFIDATTRVWRSDARDQGRAYVDALVQAGFAKESMQVTSDLSTVGNPAESLQFSVAWSDAECLVGQVGPSTGEPQTAVMPRLADGSCLAGRTRPIDW